MFKKPLLFPLLSFPFATKPHHITLVSDHRLEKIVRKSAKLYISGCSAIRQHQTLCKNKRRSGNTKPFARTNEDPKMSRNTGTILQFANTAAQNQLLSTDQFRSGGSSGTAPQDFQRVKCPNGRCTAQPTLLLIPYENASDPSSKLTLTSLNKYINGIDTHSPWYHMMPCHHTI